MKTVVTAILARVELTTYNDDGQVIGRSLKNIAAVEAEMSDEMRQWLIERPQATEA